VQLFRRRMPSTIRSRLIAIVAASMIPTLSLVVLAGYRLQTAVLEMTRSEGGRVLEAVSFRQSIIVKHAEQMLLTISESDESKSGTVDDMARFLSALIIRNGLYSTLLAADLSGTVVAAGIPVVGYSVADRTYFQEALRTRRFVVGPILTSRSTGVLMIPAALPAFDGAGNLRYVLVAAIRISAFSESFYNVVIPEGSALELADREGKRVLRLPADPAFPVGGQVEQGYLTAAETPNAAVPGAASFIGKDIRVDDSYEPAFRVGMRMRSDLAAELATTSTLGLVAMALVSAAASIFLANYLYSRSIGKRIRALTELAESIGELNKAAPRSASGSRNELAILERTLKESILSRKAHELGLRKAADAVRDSLKEKEVLLKEIHHRVKNNFQVVSSLISLQAMSAKDEEVLRMFEESRSRIHSMALIHEQLYQSENLSMIDFGDYSRTLADQVALSYRERAEGIAVEVLAGRAPLSIETAVPLGLLLNELLSNCFKHAFPGVGRGRITIELSSPEEGRGRLSVADDGVGMPAIPAARRPGSLGLELVETLSDQLRGALSSGPAFPGAPLPGTRFGLEFPLPAEFRWTNPVSDRILDA
jgi:two-component sensor histidine kinase